MDKPSPGRPLKATESERLVGLRFTRKKEGGRGMGWGERVGERDGRGDRGGGEEKREGNF